MNLVLEKNIGSNTPTEGPGKGGSGGDVRLSENEGEGRELTPPPPPTNRASSPTGGWVGGQRLAPHEVILLRKHTGGGGRGDMIWKGVLYLCVFPP